MNRRRFLTGLSGVLGTAALSAAGRDTFAVPSLNKSKSDWKVLLPSERYAVLFEEDTERPFSSPLNHEKRPGTLFARGASCRYSIPLISSTAAPAGPASGTRCPVQWQPRRTSS